jgi:hypothetical protein
VEKERCASFGGWYPLWRLVSRDFYARTWRLKRRSSCYVAAESANTAAWKHRVRGHGVQEKLDIPLVSMSWAIWSTEDRRWSLSEEWLEAPQRCLAAWIWITGRQVRLFDALVNGSG